MAGGNDRAAHELIGRIYDAAYEPALWRHYVDGMLKATDAAGGQVIALDPARGRAEVIASQGPGDLEKEYEAYFWKVGAWRPVGDAQPLGKAWASHRLITDGAFEEQEFYRDFLRRMDGLFYFCGGQAFRRGSFQVVSGALRTRRQGPFADDDIRLADLLLPHLRRATRIQRKFGRLRAERAAMASVLDRADYAVFLLDRRRGICGMNRAAEAMTRAGDGLTWRLGRLAAETPRSDLALLRLIEGAVEPRSGLAPEGGPIALPRKNGRPLAAFAAPAPRRDPWRDGAVAAVLLVSDPDASTELAAQALRRIYGLTPREAQLAGLIGEGNGLGEAAGALGVTRHTAQSHLKAIYAKTGLRSQAALARLIGSLGRIGRQDF